MRSDKRQTFAMIGIALLVAAGILAYIGVSQPKIYDGAGTLSASDSSAAKSAVHQEGSNNVIVSNSGNGNVSVVISDTQSSKPDYPLNLNTATVDELMSVPSLGEVRANAIVAYREQIGHFDSVAQIMNIKGIGEKIYAKVSPYLTV